MPPTLPGHRHSLRTLPGSGQTETELQPARPSLTVDVGMPSARQAPPRLGLSFLPPDHMRGQEQRQEQSSEALTNIFVLLCVQTTALLLKSVDAANQPQRKVASFDTWAPFHPSAAQDRSTRTVPKAPLQAIPSSLSFWVCLGRAFA